MQRWRRRKNMPTVTFECECDLTGFSGINGVQLYVKNGEEWRSVLLFVFHRPQKVRDGKKLRMNQYRCVIGRVGGAVESRTETEV